MPEEPDAGWYDDPEESEQLRYWDGSRWTGQTRVGATPRIPRPTRPPPGASSPEATTPDGPASAGPDSAADRSRFWRRVRIVAVVLVAGGLASAGGAAGWWLRGWLDNPTPVDIQVAVDRPISQPDARQAAGGMPSLIGLREDQARRVLLDADVDPAQIAVAEVPAAGEGGVVVDQEPAPGADRSGPVLLGISTPTDVPELAGLPESEARDLLAELGSRVTLEHEYRQGADEGTILASEPPAGERLPESVELTVAAAPSSVFLTDVRALSGGCSIDDDVAVSGEVLSNSLVCRPEDEVELIEYDLGRRANTLEAVLGQSDDGPADRVVRYRFLVDGAVVVDEQVGFGRQRPISVSVEGGLRLRIEVTQNDPPDSWSAPDPLAVIGSPRLIGAPDDIDALSDGS